MSSIAPGPGSTSTFRIEPSSRYRTATLHFEQAQVPSALPMLVPPCSCRQIAAVSPMHAHNRTDTSHHFLAPSCTTMHPA